MPRPKATVIEPTWEPGPCEHRSRMSQYHSHRAVFQVVKCLACDCEGYQAAGSTRITWEPLTDEIIAKLDKGFKDS